MGKEAEPGGANPLWSVLAAQPSENDVTSLSWGLFVKLEEGDGSDLFCLS